MLKGQIISGEWIVCVDSCITDIGFECEIYVGLTGILGTNFKHHFRHSRSFATDGDAVLDGLREGMAWIRLKQSETIHL
jgi:hypothetical protein